VQTEKTGLELERVAFLDAEVARYLQGNAVSEANDQLILLALKNSQQFRPMRSRLWEVILSAVLPTPSFASKAGEPEPHLSEAPSN
jgi:hypothetical protein